jgi:hypothetical protein
MLDLFLRERIQGVHSIIIENRAAALQMRIAYIVSLFFGPRRVQSQAYRKDRLAYLSKHLDQLKKLNHNVSKVIFVINEHDHRSGRIETERASEMISNFKDISSSVIIRENEGYSYAAWDAGLKKHSKDFDYCLLVEDDYAPVANNFDEKFREYFDKDDKLGYVCQLWWNHGGCTDFHAGISNGLIKTSAYLSTEGFELTNFGSKDSYNRGIENQKFFLNSLIKKGYTARDIGDKYRNYFLNHRSELKLYGNKDGEDLILPIHENAKWI